MVVVVVLLAFLSCELVLFWAAAAAANCPALVLGKRGETLATPPKTPATTTARRHHRAPLMLLINPIHSHKKGCLKAGAVVSLTPLSCSSCHLVKSACATDRRSVLQTPARPPRRALSLARAGARAYHRRQLRGPSTVTPSFRIHSRAAAS